MQTDRHEIDGLRNNRDNRRPAVRISEDLMGNDPRIERVDACAYVILTDGPEADGTLAWDSAALVTAKIDAGGQRWLGYTYSDSPVVGVIIDKLAPLRPRRFDF